MPTLTIILLALAVVFFAVSIASRRAGPQNTGLALARKVLAAIILALAAYYFYQRFAA